MPIHLPPIEEQRVMVDEFEIFRDGINREIEALNDKLKHEKWRLYSRMELGDVMKAE